MNGELLWKKWAPTIEKDRAIFTWTDDHELAWLAEHASTADNICEIGSYHGRSALVMARAAKSDAHLLCVDKFVDPGVEDVCRHNLKEFTDSGKVAIFNGTSRCFEGAYHIYDFAFIDGGHLFEDVSLDITNLVPAMKSGSILSGHDWRSDMNDGVNRGVLAHFKRAKINTFHSIWWVQIP